MTQEKIFKSHAWKMAIFRGRFFSALGFFNNSRSKAWNFEFRGWFWPFSSPVKNFLKKKIPPGKWPFSMHGIFGLEFQIFHFCFKKIPLGKWPFSGWNFFRSKNWRFETPPWKWPFSKPGIFGLEFQIFNFYFKKIPLGKWPFSMHGIFQGGKWSFSGWNSPWKMAFFQVGICPGKWPFSRLEFALENGHFPGWDLCACVK